MKTKPIEKRENNQTKKQPSLFLSLSRGFRGLFLISAVTTGLAVAFNFLMPRVIQITVDSVIGDHAFDLPAFLLGWIDQMGGRDFLRANLIVCAAAALVFSTLSGVFNYLCRVSTAKASEGMINKLRNQLYSHIQKLPYHWHVEHQTGDIIQRCTSDVDVVRNFLAEQLLEMLRTILLLILALALMFSINVNLSLLAVLFLPILLAYSCVFYTKIAGRFKSADEAEGDLSAMVQENFTGVRVVRAFGRQKYEIDRFDQKNTFFSRLWIRLGNLLAYYWGIGDFVSNLQVMCVLIGGVVVAVNGGITVGEFMLFVTYNSMLVWPVRSLGRILSEMSKMGVSLDRINEILSAEPEQDAPDAFEPDMTGDIVFEHVSFDYTALNRTPEDNPDAAPPRAVLQDISFTIPAGATLGILGGTGSGKSTLMYLLDRLYDLPEGCGRITIGGVDIRRIKRDWLRKNFGFVLQEPFLFSKTIRENIGITGEELAGPENMLDNIRHCASIAAVDDAIGDFAQGYDTIVGERGVTLSGGQKQRVAIARTLMQNAPIMAFDDSLSAVDAETDAKIRTALRKSTGNSTVILISHRITTLMRADNILVLENGRIAQQGTHDELSKQEGIYRQIYEIQGLLESELTGLELQPEAKGGEC